MNKAIPEKEILKKLYCDEGLTFKQIGERLKMATGKIYKYFKFYDLPSRALGMPKGTRLWDEKQKHEIGIRFKNLNRTQKHCINISEGKKCHYNGINGYGHTKDHASGYVLAYAPDHPNATCDGYVFLHTIIMERFIGRYLNLDEVVHHENHIRNDNEIENLVLMKEKQHMSMHMKQRHEQRRNALSIAQ